MRYSIEPRDKTYIKGYGFLSFAINIGKNLSNKYSQKLPDGAKKSTAEAIKVASNREIQKTAEATGDLVDNEIADKITNISKTFQNALKTDKNEKDIPKERYIPPEKRQ